MGKDDNYEQKVIEAQRGQINIDELYNTFDDDTIENYQKATTPDRGASFEQLLNRDDYLADNFDEQEIADLNNLEMENSGEIPHEGEFLEEEIPGFNNTQEAMQWAIDNAQVVRINYKIQGKRRGEGGRRGIKLKREIGLPPGSTINRVVEPHEIYYAGTGNLLLLSYDRSIRGIRAFIINNIISYDFTGKEFKRRDRITPQEYNKGIKTMSIDIFEKLKNVGDNIEKEGLNKKAAQITKVMKDLLEVKTAQYIGAQGYWLRQKRCWDNCYRSKRASSPKDPAQKVWMECWKEYTASINNDISGWEKYSEEDVSLYKFSEGTKKTILQKEQQLFIKAVDNKILQGRSRGVAVYESFQELGDKCNLLVVKNAEKLSSLAEEFKKEGNTNMADELSLISISLLKEADFGNHFLAPWNWGKKSRIIERLKNILARIDEIMSLFQWGNREASSFIDKVGQIQENHTCPECGNEHEGIGLCMKRIHKISLDNEDVFIPDEYGELKPPAKQAQVAPQTNIGQRQPIEQQTSQQVARKRLKQEIKDKYFDFVKDLKEEMRDLSGKLAQYPTGVKQILSPAVQSIGDYLQTNDNLFATNHSDAVFANIRKYLPMLSQRLTSAITGLSSQAFDEGETVSSPISQETVQEGAAPGGAVPSMVTPSTATNKNIPFPQVPQGVGPLMQGINSLPISDFMDLYGRVISRFNSVRRTPQYIDYKKNRAGKVQKKVI